MTVFLRRLHHPQTTVRWRLTLLYGGLFLVCGAALLAMTYTLVSHAATQNGPTLFARAGKLPPTLRPPGATLRTGKAFPRPLQTLLASPNGRRAAQVVVNLARGADLNQLEIESGIALGIMAIISGLLGWLVAGRVLRPLQTITATAQEISEANLHRRLALDGPRDELRQLADTIDALLARLEAAFDAQRRFVANASHELRTPLTTARALLEMVMTDPHATVATFREACEQVLQENEHQEQLIDALLTLAQGQRGLERCQPVDIASVVQAVADAHGLEAAASGVRLEVSVDPEAIVSGDPRLIERLASNLVQNALRHNTPDGSARVDVRRISECVILRVVNTGRGIPHAEVDRLLQPFQRLAQDRVGHGGGLGLGLSIVAAITGAHKAGLTVSPRPEGGLEVEVRFAASAPAQLVLDHLPERVAG